MSKVNALGQRSFTDQAHPSSGWNQATQKIPKQFDPLARNLSHPEASERIHQTFEDASGDELEQGKTWFFEANHRCRELLEVADPNLELNLGLVAAIVAALSPMQSWSNNLLNAEKLIQEGANRVKGLGYAISDAQRILGGESVESVLFDPGRNNPKVRAFYDNIHQPEISQAVTIDRHMYACASGVRPGRRYRGIHPETYQQIEEIISEIAANSGLLPHQVQATCWVVTRRELGLTSPLGYEDTPLPFDS